jgi:hypothetical protein
MRWKQNYTIRSLVWKYFICSSKQKTPSSDDNRRFYLNIHKTPTADQLKFSPKLHVLLLPKTITVILQSQPHNCFPAGQQLQEFFWPKNRRHHSFISIAMYVQLISPWMIQSPQGNGSIDGLFNDTHCSKEHRPKLTNGGMIRYLPHCSGNGFYICLQMNRIWIGFYSVGPPFFSVHFSHPPRRKISSMSPSLFTFVSPFLISAAPADLCAIVVFSLLYHIHVLNHVKFRISNQNHFRLIFNFPSNKQPFFYFIAYDTCNFS